MNVRRKIRNLNQGIETPDDLKLVPADSDEEGYVVYENKEKSNNEEPLSRVIGHDNQKKEILSVINWFKNSKTLREKGVSIPRGIIMMGPPGCGKSLIIKEIIKYVDVPVFVFQGKEDNIVAGIVEVFKKAREAGHSIIVFDELDLLINRDSRVIRALQENLDGVESNDDILVLTATNDIDEVPGALLRNGRLEKIVDIPYPKGEESVKLLKKTFADFNVKLPDDFDEDELAISLTRISCSGVKAIVNDVVLRNGFENITMQMIDDSIFNITDRIKDAAEEDNIQVAVHEASHALLASTFPDYFFLNRLNISGASGAFVAKEVTKGFWPYEKAIADIKISMAGVIAQKVMFGTGSRGCENDLDHARIVAYNLINRCGYSSCWETLPMVRDDSRKETQIKRRKMERKIEKLLRSCEKDVYKTVNNNKEKIMKLGNLLFEKKHLKSSEIVNALK